MDVLTSQWTSPGSLIAGTWAAMTYMGEDGYIESCRNIVGTARYIAATIAREIPELRILGSPPASVVAFKSVDPKVNILEVGDSMSKKGWHLNALQNPAALHIACTVRRENCFSRVVLPTHRITQRLTVPVKEKLISDLKESIREARESPDGKGTFVAIYGGLPDAQISRPFFAHLLHAGLGSSSAVGPQMVSTLVNTFLDSLYQA